MEPETVELIPGLPPKLRRRGENTVARLARLLVRRIPDIQANPISVITAAMRHVPEPAVIESAIADMDLAKLHEGMTVLQILVGAARAKLTRGAWVEATRVEMLEMGFPEDLCKAVMEASKRLCRSPKALAVWASRKLAEVGASQAPLVAHVLRVAERGTDRDLDAGWDFAQFWYRAYKVFPKKLKMPPDDRMAAVLAGKIHPKDAWEDDRDAQHP